MNHLPPIFLVGSERSGSNLLRSLIGNHSMVEAPVAPHFFDVWNGMLKHYGDLRRKDNMAFLIEDMLEYANHPFNDWGLKVDVRALVQQHGPTSFWDAFDLLYRSKAEMHAASVYACKGNHIFNYAFQVKAKWPDSKFIYLYRDPRDHCASWKKKPMHLKTVWDSIEKWEREQRRCLELVTKHGIEMFFMSYEDLIAETPTVMTRALNFCGLPVEEACFQTDRDKNADAASRFVYWENIDKPIIRNNAKKYKKDLTPSEVELIETKAGAVMDVLGYSCETSRRWQRPFAHDLRLRIQRRWVSTKHRDHLAKELNILHSKHALRDAIRGRAAGRKVIHFDVEFLRPTA